MGLSVVVGPGFEPISLDEAKSHCRITNTAEDGLMAGYILAARQMVEANTRRALVQQTFDYTVDFQWPWRRQFVNGCDYASPRIELPVAPVLSAADVTAVTYVDQGGTTQTLDPSQYLVTVDGPVAVIDPAYAVCWPTPRWQAATIKVRFKAGYGTTPGDTPEPLRMAMLLTIGHFFANREAVAAGTLNEIPMGYEALISPFRQSRILS